MQPIDALFQSPPNVINLVQDTTPWTDDHFKGSKALVLNDNDATFFTAYWNAVANPSGNTLTTPSWVRFST